MADDTENQPKIMTKPLPEILDELENYIKQVEEAVKESRQAAEESRDAAAEAKAAGQDAAAAARKAAEEAVAKVAQAMQDTFTEIRAEIADLQRTAQTALTLAQATNAGIAAAVTAYNHELAQL